MQKVSLRGISYEEMEEWNGWNYPYESGSHLTHLGDGESEALHKDPRDRDAEFPASNGNIKDYVK